MPVPKEVGIIVEVDQVRLEGNREPNPPIKVLKAPGVERGCRKGEKGAGVLVVPMEVPMEDRGCPVGCRGDCVNRSTFVDLGEGLAVVIREVMEVLEWVGLGDDGAITLDSRERPKN